MIEFGVLIKHFRSYFDDPQKIFNFCMLRQ